MQVIRWVIGITVFVALLLLALQNAKIVELNFLNLVTFQAPLILVVLVVFAAGVAAGLLAGVLKVARLKRQLNKLRREHRTRVEPMPHGAAPGTAPASGPGFERNALDDG
jgi:lipopolysaccharide assembly protein A